MTDTVLDLAGTEDAGRAGPAAELEAAFGSRVVHCDDRGRPAAEVAADLARSHPEVVVLGMAMGTIDALAVAAELDASHPEIATVLISWPTPELWRHALEAGVRSVVPPTAPVAEVMDAVSRLLDRVDRTRANTVDLHGPAAEEAAPAHRVITVLSPKGGVGKTTVATNLAAGLAALRPHEVAIVDVDLQFGDVADSFLLDPAHTLADVRADGGTDAAALKLMLAATSGDLYALCAPDDPASGEGVSPEAVAAAVRSLSRDLPFVVVDTGAGIDAAALAAVEQSTDLVLVGSLDVPSVRSLRKLVDALDRLGMTEARRHVVLNRADSRVGVSAADVVDTLGMPISVAVPSSVAIPSALNGGAPVVVSGPRTAPARAFQQLVGLFTEVPAAQTSSPAGWLRRLPTRSAR
jgi:pilus assembly protein CpaE